MGNLFNIKFCSICTRKLEGRGRAKMCEKCEQEVIDKYYTKKSDDEGISKKQNKH